MTSVPLRRPDTQEWRLRPRDGSPRCYIESVAQFVWRHRVDFMLAYIVLAVTAALFFWVA